MGVVQQGLVCVLGGRQLLGVLVGAVADQAFKVGHTFLHGRSVLVTLGPLLVKKITKRCMLLFPGAAVDLDAGVQGVDPLVRRGHAERVLVRSLLDDALQAADAILDRGVPRRLARLEGLQLLGVSLIVGIMLVMGSPKLQQIPHVCGLCSLELLVLVRRVAHRLLEERDALGQGGVMRMGLLDVLQLLEVLHVLILKRLQLLGVLVRRVAKGLLQVADALVNRCVAVIDICHVLGMPVVRVLQRLQFPVVLVRRVAELLLNVAHTLWQRRMVGMSYFQARQILSMPGMGVLQGLELFGVLVQRVPEQFLAVVHAFLQGGMARREHAKLPDVLREVARVLLVGRRECRQLLCVLVAGVAEGLLQVVEALAQGGVMRLRRLEDLQILRVLAVGSGVLRIGLFECSNLSRMLVR
mmetsp:Transcript_62627/g.141283  ORF Transcript_62627/g.141283 Transcript_62627/m.141283 type:complete len:412 (+) Transcript_62627:281-1516(+)